MQGTGAILEAAVVTSKRAGRVLQAPVEDRRPGAQFRRLPIRPPMCHTYLAEGALRVLQESRPHDRVVVILDDVPQGRLLCHAGVEHGGQIPAVPPSFQSRADGRGWAMMSSLALAPSSPREGSAAHEESGAVARSHIVLHSELRRRVEPVRWCV